MLTEEMTTRDPIRQIAEEIRLRLAEVAEGKGQGSVDDGGLGSKGGMADFFFVNQILTWQFTQFETISFNG